MKSVTLSAPRREIERPGRGRPDRAGGGRRRGLRAGRRHRQGALAAVRRLRRQSAGAVVSAHAAFRRSRAATPWWSTRRATKSLRLEGATGRIRWREPSASRSTPIRSSAGENILVATRSGKLITIDAGSGESPGYVQFPQPLCVAPAVDRRRSLIFQVAAHTNFSSVRWTTAPASTSIPGARAGKHRHRAAWWSRITCWWPSTTAPATACCRCCAIQPKRSDKPEPWLKPVQEIPLGGHVLTPPLVDGRRVLVTTNFRRSCGSSSSTRQRRQDAAARHGRNHDRSRATIWSAFP